MSEFLRVTLCQIFNCRNCFLYFDLFIFLLFCLSWQTLPWKTTSDEVHENHSNLLKIVSSRLLDSHMCVKTRIPSRSSQLFIVLVADMPACPWILVPFRQTKVDDVDDVLLFTETDQEVVRLDVPVQESALVNELDPLEHLNRQHQDGLVSELATTVLIQIFQ